MKAIELESIGCQELSRKEAIKTNGGILAAILLIGVAFWGGYKLGEWLASKL